MASLYKTLPMFDHSLATLFILPYLWLKLYYYVNPLTAGVCHMHSRNTCTSAPVKLPAATGREDPIKQTLPHVALFWVPAISLLAS